MSETFERRVNENFIKYRRKPSIIIPSYYEGEKMTVNYYSDNANEALIFMSFSQKAKKRIINPIKSKTYCGGGDYFFYRRRGKGIVQIFYSKKENDFLESTVDESVVSAKGNYVSILTPKKLTGKIVSIFRSSSS